jgi:hypothetical protein
MKIRLGDALAFIFKITGIKAIVKRFYPDCGCDKRQEALNFKINRK